MKKFILLSFILSIGITSSVGAQAGVFNPFANCVTDANGQCVPNTILTAMPFLRIIPDARGGAMGDAGIATSADASSLHYNGAKLAFAEQEVGLGVTYTPWLRNLGLNDVYLAYLSGYKQIDKLQTVAFSLRFFSLGDINFTDINGDPAGTGSPREMEFAVAYARKLGSNLSAGLTGKYIYSNLASGQMVGGVEIVSANAFAADISLQYVKENKIVANGGKFSMGLTLSNIGSKVTYTGNPVKDFLPGNFGLGAAMELNFDKYNTITFAFDINKLLAPSPIVCQELDAEGNIVTNPNCSVDGDNIPDYRQKGLFSGVFGSFGDAQGGAREEFKEISYSLGIEYWYDKQFAVRAGYFYEHPEKGDRQYLTLGVGLKYNVFGLNLAYLTPTNNRRNPLDNTLRFSMLYDFESSRGDN